MKDKNSLQDNLIIKTFEKFVNNVDYSFMDNLKEDPEATQDGNDFIPRQVFSGHYVPVKPTPLSSPEYVAHSKKLFTELGLSSLLLEDKDFKKLFSGDLSTFKKANAKFWLGYWIRIVNIWERI